MKGILLIACGHRNYGKMAVTLAASIRMIDKDVNICLAYTESALTNLSEAEKGLFNHFVELNKKTYTLGSNKSAWIKTKVHIDEITPYEETLFLDVDQVWLWKKTPSQVLEELGQHEFVIENTGYIGFDNIIYPESENWVKMDEVKESYKLTTEKFYRVHSEFIYWKKCENTKKYFKKVKEVYTSPLVKPFGFAGAYPDEFAFAIAISVLEYYPQIDNFIPTWWYPRENRDEHLYRIADNYNTISIGGAFVDETSKKNYNIVAQRAYNELDLLYPYQITDFNDKRKFLTERQKT
jgi:hypothetical protein